jgi:hypothetical protein
MGSASRSAVAGRCRAVEPVLLQQLFAFESSPSRVLSGCCGLRDVRCDHLLPLFLYIEISECGTPAAEDMIV